MREKATSVEDSPARKACPNGLPVAIFQYLVVLALDEARRRCECASSIYRDGTNSSVYVRVAKGMQVALANRPKLPLLGMSTFFFHMLCPEGCAVMCAYT